MTVGLQSSPSASWESRECLEDESIEKIRSNLEGAPPVVVAALAIAAIEAVVRDLGRWRRRQVWLLCRSG